MRIMKLKVQPLICMDLFWSPLLNFVCKVSYSFLKEIPKVVHTSGHV